jgi:hypothetical protein
MNERVQPHRKVKSISVHQNASPFYRYRQAYPTRNRALMALTDRTHLPQSGRDRRDCRFRLGYRS